MLMGLLRAEQLRGQGGQQHLYHRSYHNRMCYISLYYIMIYDIIIITNDTKLIIITIIIVVVVVVVVVVVIRNTPRTAARPSGARRWREAQAPAPCRASRRAAARRWADRGTRSAPAAEAAPGCCCGPSPPPAAPAWPRTCAPSGRRLALRAPEAAARPCGPSPRHRRGGPSWACWPCSAAAPPR